jgi:hypothetical protein
MRVPSSSIPPNVEDTGVVALLSSPYCARIPATSPVRILSGSDGLGKRVMIRTTLFPSSVQVRADWLAVSASKPKCAG